MGKKRNGSEALRKGALQHPKHNRTENVVPEVKKEKKRKKATEKKREEKKHSNEKELYKSGNKTLRTDSLVKEDFSKVPKRNVHNRKQSY